MSLQRMKGKDLDKNLNIIFPNELAYQIGMKFLKL